MFKVINRATNNKETVYAVKTVDNGVLFLVYRKTTDEWIWRDSGMYYPIQ